MVLGSWTFQRSLAPLRNAIPVLCASFLTLEKGFSDDFLVQCPERHSYPKGKYLVPALSGKVQKVDAVSPFNPFLSFFQSSEDVALKCDPQGGTLGIWNEGHSLA